MIQRKVSWPIIVIPGIMASRLRIRGLGHKIWDPDDFMFMLGLVLRSADSRARLFDPTITPGEVIEQPPLAANRSPDFVRRGWGGLAWDYYGKGLVQLQEEFHAEGGVVFAFGYDWRRSNRLSGAQFLEFIGTSIRPHFQRKPIVITHSMGGLVARAACRSSWQGIPGCEMIAAVIHTFQPTYGTPEAYTKLRLGESDDRALGRIIGKSHREISIVGSGVETLFQLLPNHLFPGIPNTGRNWLTWDSNVEDASERSREPYSIGAPYGIYRERNGCLGLVNHSEMEAEELLLPNQTVAGHPGLRLNRILKNLDEAEAFHTELVDDYSHPCTYVLFGDGFDTVVGARLTCDDDHGLGTKVNRVMGRGDHVVSRESSMTFACDGKCIGQSGISGVEHAKMFNDRRAMEQIIEFLRDCRREVPETDMIW